MTQELPSSATLVLSAVRRMMLAEVIAQPAAETITVRRDMFTLIAASLGEVMDTIATLEESHRAADRLGRALHIAKAEVARLEMLLTARDLERIGRPRLVSVNGSAEVVDLAEVWAREKARRPEGTIA